MHHVIPLITQPQIHRFSHNVAATHVSPGYCFSLKDSKRTLGHEVKYVVQEEDSWHDHKEISPAHGKANICGWCYEGEKRKGSRFVRKKSWDQILFLLTEHELALSLPSSTHFTSRTSPVGMFLTVFFVGASLASGKISGVAMS